MFPGRLLKKAAFALCVTPPNTPARFGRLKTLDDLFQHALKDLYSAESQLVQALPKMAAAAKDGRLKAGIELHLQETRNQIVRLEKTGKFMDFNLDAETCKAMEGLVPEGQKT